jgi:CubicO group peptidase (beta-lactamase class C family)
VKVTPSIAAAALVLLADCSGADSSGPSDSSSAPPATANVPPASTTVAAGAGVTRAQIDAAASKIDGIVQSAMASTGVPGVAVAVVIHDQVVLAKGYGVRTVGQPEMIDTDTVFQLASMSKPVTSTAVAALVGKGVIKWSDPVHTDAPNLVFSDPWVTDHVTFADLFSHRTGLPGAVGDSLELLGYTRDQILQRLRYVPLNPFRATYGYTNFGLTAGGDAAAKAAGVSFEDMMDQQLFQPAGMTATSARHADFLARPDRATIHARIDGNWVAGPPRMPDAQAPAGGVSSNITDMATWVRLQLAGGMLNGQQVVAQDAVAATHSPQIPLSPQAAPDNLGAFYGLGWILAVDHLGEVRWGHSGAFTNGAATTVQLLPKEQLGVVVLTNGQPVGVAEAVADDIIDDVVKGAPTQDWVKHWGDLFTAMYFTPDPSLAAPPGSPTPAQPNGAYVGSYANDFYGTFEVTEGPGGLSLLEGQAEHTYPLTHFDGNTFIYFPVVGIPHIPAPIEFTTGPDGKASAINIGDADGAGLGTLTRA